MIAQLHHSWSNKLNQELSKPYFKALANFVEHEYAANTCYPPKDLIFSAFNYCHFDDVRVVIIGQDPYHGPNQAQGLCFSVNEGVKFPPSLLNIFKEIKMDLSKEIPPHGSLIRWANQGVLLLNATLTVRASSPGSHQNRGWETFTDAVIRNLSSQRENIVFLLWGAFAHKKEELIDNKKHCILKSPHPSPFSANRGFFGNKHFSKTNEYLLKIGKTPIDW